MVACSVTKVSCDPVYFGPKLRSCSGRSGNLEKCLCNSISHFFCQVYSERLAGALGLEQDDEGGLARSGRDSGLDGTETVLPTLSNEVRMMEWQIRSLHF